MLTINQRRRRKAEVTARAQRPDHMHSYCRIIGCGKPARAGTDDGLDTWFCRSHADHRQRHGDPVKKSYPASVMNPYRRAAFEWLTVNADDFWVKSAIEGVRALYQRAGPHVEAFRLRGMNARQRADAAWARLREAHVDPRLPLAAWLAVEMIIRDDSHPALKDEYRRVQAAKIVHRMASGTHKTWTSRGHGGRVRAEELHTYPASRGRVLRHVGQDLELVAELVADKHLDDIRACMVQRVTERGLASRSH